MSEQERETEVVSGQLVGIIQKAGGKTQAAVKTDPNSQYDRKVWFKDDAPFANDLRGRIGQPVSLLAEASYWTNQEGKQIRSLWAQSLNVGSVAWQGTEGTESVQVVPLAAQQAQSYVQQNRLDADPKTADIHFQVAAKIAVEYLAYLPPEQRRLGMLADVTRYVAHLLDTREKPDVDPSAQGYATQEELDSTPF